MSTTVILLVLILLVLVYFLTYIGRDIAAIREMIFDARRCPECHGTGQVPEEKRDFPDIKDWTCFACKGTGKKL